MLFLEYPPCTTCKKAKNWLMDHGVEFTARHIKEQNPTAEVTFTDVQPGQFYSTAVAWAVEKGITNGISATEFGVGGICNRAQVVTFLYRTYN